MAIFRPHPYQQYAIERVLTDRAVGLMLDMGLGKTAIVLSAIRELIYNRCEISRVLVIAPKKVAEATWQAEARKWDGLRDLKFATVLGDVKTRQAALKRDADVYVTSRDNVQWLCDAYKPAGRAVWPFDMVVVDESSSFKNPASKRFRALKRELPNVRKIVILTGTPAPNGVADLWAQIYLLDQGERLGRFVTAFRERYFDYNAWSHELKPKKGAADAIQNAIKDICVSMSAKDYLQLPDMVMDDIPVLLTDTAAKAYRELEKDMVLSVDGEDITAMSAASLTGKLLQLCSGSVYDEDGTARNIHDCKVEAFQELLERLNGEHALVFYGFKHEVGRLKDACKGLRFRELNDATDVEAWNMGDVDVLLAHPASCAYGLNLQTGGRHIVWFTLSWSLEQYQQANARLHRQGQEKPVIVHRLLVSGGMDEQVVAALDSKDAVQTKLMNAIKARIADLKT